ncbi:MAG: hypothetical protein ACYCT2_04660 [Thermoplasmataceae archaeon]
MKLYPQLLVVILVAAIIGVSSYAVYVHYNQGYHNTSDGKIQFVQSGLLAGVNWTVKVTGVDYTEQKTTNSSSMTFSSLNNGVYSYSISAETGYSMQQSGQANASGYTGVVDVGDVHTLLGSGYNSYPLNLKITLNFTPLTPSLSIVVSSTSNVYFIYITDVSWEIKMSTVNFTIVNTDGQEYTINLSTALNRADTVGGIWTVNVSGSSDLLGSTEIVVGKISGTSGDANVSQFIFTYTLTGAIMGEIGLQ